MTRLGRRATRGARISIISLVGAWHGLLLADRSMKPLTPAYLWSNTEPAPACNHLRQDKGLVDWFCQASGCMVNATYPAFTMQMLKGRGMNIHDAFIVDEGSYLNWVLTGEFVQSQCLASGSGFVNVHTGSYDRDILLWLGVTEGQLPALVPFRWLQLRRVVSRELDRVPPLSPRPGGGVLRWHRADLPALPPRRAVPRLG